jgi:holdfast attachment protein HfaA
MAVALLVASHWERAMPFSRILAVTAIAAFGLVSAAQAGDWTNSASYNGIGAAAQNAPSNFSLRDGNGNLTVVNGQFVGSSYSSSSGAQSASAYAGGVGTSGGQQMSGQATAIGNSLNVVVVGNHNTTVVDSSQTNNGNQTANAALNAKN